MTVDEKGLEAVARAIWNLRREEEDRCDMELEDMGKSHPVWDEARAAITAYESARSAEPVAWPIATDDDVEALARECDWDNRKYMTPADYAIWSERMRKFARLAHPTPVATPSPDPEQPETRETPPSA